MSLPLTKDFQVNVTSCLNIEECEIKRQRDGAELRSRTTKFSIFC